MIDPALKLQISGYVGNFREFEEGKLFRGAQPPALAWPLIAKTGVKLVVNLRGTDFDPTEKAHVESVGMRYERWPMSGWNKPSELEVDTILDVVIQNIGRSQPIFIHCQHGDDRTGVLCACFRIRNDGWDNQRALDEAKTDGMSWTEVFMKEFVEDYRSKETLPNGTAD